MTRVEMIKFIKENPYVNITHTLFDKDEYIYSDMNGIVWDEHDYLFEDWCMDAERWVRGQGIGIRERIGGLWDDGWFVKN